MQAKTWRANIMLLCGALIWGTAFAAQRMVSDTVEPFTFNAIRSYIAALALLLVFFIFRRRRPEQRTDAQRGQERKLLLCGGVLCGLFLCAAATLQQFGITYTSAGKAGFITTLYIVLVPLLGVFMKKRTTLGAWIAVAVAAAGLYLLCVTEQFTIALGDIYVMLCAVFFSMHILCVDYFSPKVNGVLLSCLQFLVMGIICTVLAFIYETPDPAAILSSWAPILYVAVMSSGVGYTLQILAQKDTSPVVASLIMSLESVFAVLAGWLLLDEALSARELLGCALMFAAVILAQPPPGLFRRRTRAADRDPGAPNADSD